jgi:hypothetical protein
MIYASKYGNLLIYIEGMAEEEVLRECNKQIGSYKVKVKDFTAAYRYSKILTDTPDFLRAVSFMIWYL